VNADPTAYGLWSLVVINTLVFVVFAFSFTYPRTGRDWRSLGAFSAFVVALFTEMYGIPLTIYLLSGWLGQRFPEADLFSHQSGHLWQTLLGVKGDPHLTPLHWLSEALIIGGVILLGAAWDVLFEAHRAHKLASTGPYAYLRHPQYAGFILILVGFLVQWPTLLTLIMFPILATMYFRLARAEEREALAQFGEAYRLYAANTPAFFPRLSRVHVPQLPSGGNGSPTTWHGAKRS